MKVPLFTHNTQLHYGVKSDAGYSLESIEISSASPEDLSSVVKISPLFKENVLVVDSSKSGIGRDKRDIYKPLLKPLLDSLEILHTYISTTSADTIAEIAGSLKSGDHSIIMISGDTSVNEFINGLLADQTGTITMYFVPFGTGNSLALSLGIENEFVGIQKALAGASYPLNLYKAKLPADCWIVHEGKPIRQLGNSIDFVVVLSWGFHASLVADSDTVELRKYGLDRFKMAAMQNLQCLQKYDATTVLGDNIIEGPFAYWLVTPSRKFEPTFEILPLGDIFESSLYLISFKTEGQDGAYIMDIMTQVYNQGSHIHNPKVTYTKTTEDEIILKFNGLTPEQRRLCIDGTIVKVPESGEIVIKPCNNSKFDWTLMMGA